MKAQLVEMGSPLEPELVEGEPLVHVTFRVSLADSRKMGEFLYDWVDLQATKLDGSGEVSREAPTVPAPAPQRDPRISTFVVAPDREKARRLERVDVRWKGWVVVPLTRALVNDTLGMATSFARTKLVQGCHVIMVLDDPADESFVRDSLNQVMPNRRWSIYVWDEDDPPQDLVLDMASNPPLERA